MHRWLPSLAFVLICAAPAAALDLPERKAGFWELKMTFEGGDVRRRPRNIASTPKPTN